jgi:hypothetical protein
VLAVLGAELARSVTLRTFAECVRDFAVPMADRTCVKIAIAAMTGIHHELHTGGDVILAPGDAETVTAVDSASGDISPFPAPPNALET